MKIISIPIQLNDERSAAWIAKVGKGYSPDKSLLALVGFDSEMEVNNFAGMMEFTQQEFLRMSYHSFFSLISLPLTIYIFLCSFLFSPSSCPSFFSLISLPLTIYLFFLFLSFFLFLVSFFLLLDITTSHHLPFSLFLSFFLFLVSFFLLLDITTSHYLPFFFVPFFFPLPRVLLSSP